MKNKYFLLTASVPNKDGSYQQSTIALQCNEAFFSSLDINEHLNKKNNKPIEMRWNIIMIYELTEEQFIKYNSK